MAIVVKHGAGTAAPIAAAAFGGAQGHVRQVAQRQMAAQTGRREDAELANRRRVDAAALGHTRGLERMDFNSQLQQRAAEGAQGRRRDDLEFGLTTRQNAEMNRIAEAEAAALSSTDYTDEEKGELRRRFAAKRAGIQPVSRPRQQTPAEIFKARTHVDSRTGAIYPIDEKGQIGKPIYEPPPRQPSAADRIKAVQAATVLATDPLTNKFSQSKFDSAMRQMIGGAQGGQGAGAPAMGMDLDHRRPGPAGVPGEPVPTTQMDSLGWAERQWNDSAPSAGMGLPNPVPQGGVDLPGIGPPAVWDVPPAKPVSQLQGQIQEVSGGQTVRHPLEPRDIENLPTANYQLERVEAEIEEMRADLVWDGAPEVEHRAERFDPNTGKALGPRKRKRSGSSSGSKGMTPGQIHLAKASNARILRVVEQLKDRAKKIKAQMAKLERGLEERRGVQLMMDLKGGR